MTTLIERVQASRNKFVVEKVPGTSWGDDVYCRSAIWGERDELEACIHQRNKSRSADDPRGMKALVVAFCLCDQDGQRLFTLSEEDLQAIAELPASDVNAVADVAMRLCGFTKDDVKELEANLPNAPA